MKLNFTISFILASILSIAQTPQLVKDLFTDPVGHGSLPVGFIEMNGYAYFQAWSRETSGHELWRTDGTAAGTELVRDIYPGPEDGAIHGSVVHNNILYFAASEDQGQSYLWRTDGTAQGTYVVKTIPSAWYTEFNNKLYFAGADDLVGSELWESDGTEAGTVLVKDLRPGPLGSTPSDFMVAGNLLFFEAGLDSTGDELWVTDGTAGGTQLVKDIYPGSMWSSIEQMTAVGNLLFFIADNGTNGEELWVSDGTTVGTMMVKDIRAGSSSSSPNFLEEFNGKLYFRAFNGGSDRLWVSDGTGPGTVMVDSTGANAPAHILNVNNQFLLFAAFGGGVGGQELWRSDGTANGTYLVKDIDTSGSSSPDHFTFVNGTVFFTAEDDVNGNELWKTDGTANGTVMVKDIRPGSASSLPDELAVFGNHLIFEGFDDSFHREPWISDGTEAGTVMIRNIATEVRSNNLQAMTDVSGSLFFMANDSVGRGLYRTNGTTAGTQPLGYFSSAGDEMAVLGTGVVFAASSDTTGSELGISDGTSTGTGLLKDLRPGPFTSFLSQLTPWNNKVYFSATDGDAYGLWETDGSEAGTVMVKDSLRIYAYDYSDADLIVPALGQLFMAADESGTFDDELWKSDGTDAGTQLVKDINLIGAGRPIHITEFNGNIYFSATDSSGSHQLWKSDGTASGTQMLKEINPDPDKYVNAFGPFIPVLNELFFPASDGTNGWELWKTDGTANGTEMVKDINPGEQSGRPHDLIELSGKLIFSAYTQGTGQELWISDGTGSGTQLLKDIGPGNISGMYHRPAVYTKHGPDWDVGTTIIRAGDYVYFTGNDGVSNFELWRTDGTAGGTEEYGEIIPGEEGSHPYDYVLSGDRLFFSAFHPDYGRELWVMDVPVGLDKPEFQRVLHVHPNPTSDYIVVEGVRSATGIITNTTGIVVAVEQLTSNENTVDVSSLPAGMYFLSVGNRVAKFMRH